MPWQLSFEFSNTHWCINRRKFRFGLAAKFIQQRSIHPDYHLLTAENTAKLQEKGFQVFPWTVNEPKDLKKIKSFNVNGIISDFPDRI
jgi:glycerophosphoryl diester phosphodiesterase